MPKLILHPCVALSCYPFHSHTKKIQQPHTDSTEVTCGLGKIHLPVLACGKCARLPGQTNRKKKKIVMSWNFKRKKGETRTEWQTDTTRNVDEVRNILVSRGREANLAIWASTVSCLNVHFSSCVCMWSTQTCKPEPDMVVCQWGGGWGWGVARHSLTHLFAPSLSTVYIWNTASVSF